MIAVVVAVVALVLGAIGQVQAYHLRRRVVGLEFARRQLTRQQREATEQDLETLLRIVAGQDAEAQAVVRQLGPDTGDRLAGLGLDELADVLGEDLAVRVLDVPAAAERILRDEQ